jgi:flagellar protein FlgJ
MESKGFNVTAAPLPDGSMTNERPGKDERLRKACADFESLFIYYMFKTMHKTVPESGLLNKISGKDTYEMMMDQKVSEDLSKKGGLGLQKMLFNQINKSE